MSRFANLKMIILHEWEDLFCVLLTVDVFSKVNVRKLFFGIARKII